MENEKPTKNRFAHTVEKQSCVSFVDMFNVEVTLCDVDDAQHVR